jgi:cytochrome c553
MKKLLVAVAFALVATSASATIAGGSHDLTVLAGNASLPACSYCHTPHVWVASNVVGGPLWNRNARPTTDYSVYSSTTFTQTPVLGPASLVCLSCHDGRAMGQVNNGVAPGGTLVPVGAFANVGQDLSNDHPVGVLYTVTTGYNDITGNPNVTLYGTSRVECGSCHDPHGTSDGVRSGAVFARWAPAVDLCAQCHAK